MWEGDYTDEAELEDWAAAIDWHSTGFLQDSGGASTTSSCASHDDSADNRGRRTAINTFEVDVSGKTNNDPPNDSPNDPPRLVGGVACSHFFFEEMDGWLLLGLPEELQLEVLSLLSPRELATVGAVCRRLRGLVNGERSLRKSLVGLPERYLVFRPRIPLADLEQSPQPQAHQHLVLDYLRDEGFLFVSLDEEDARVVRDFKKCATAYLAGLEERSQGRRKKMQYSKKAGSRSPVGYAEMDELHGYLARRTRRHKKKTFPWPTASKKEKELAHRYWGIMTRVVAGLLRNVADSLDIPHAMLLSLLQSDPSQEEAWLIERIERKSSNPGSLADRQPASPKVLLSVGKTQGVRTNTSAAHEWNQPVLKMFHFREGQPIRPNFRTMHEYSRGLFKLATAFNDGSTPCGVQMLMPRAPNASHRNFLPLFKLARENDICVFAGFSLSKLCQVFSGPMGIRPVYLTANVGYDYPAAPSGSACIQFDAHVSYPRLHHIIEQAAATRGILWSQPVSERFRCTNREFFNKKNPFGAFWFRSLNRKDNTKPLPKKVKWIVVGGAVACVAVPLVVVASPIWLPVGGMVWVCRERAAIRADAAER